MASGRAARLHGESVSLSNLRSSFLRSTQLYAALRLLPAHLLCFCDCGISSPDAHNCTAVYPSRHSVEWRSGKMHGIQDGLYRDFGANYSLRLACVAAAAKYCLFDSSRPEAENNVNFDNVHGSLVSPFLSL